MALLAAAPASGIETARADTMLSGTEAAGPGPGNGIPELAGDDPGQPAIRYSSDLIFYDVTNQLIRLSGNARVRYREIMVTGDTIEFDTRRQTLTVRQGPVLYDRSDSIYGDRMVYDFRARRGWIYGGRTKFDRGRYWGRRIRQVGERTLHVDYGRYTTCDAAPPHFYFWSRRMKIELDDKIIASPVVLCFSDIPVLAIPFWFFPLRRDRHSGFMVPRIGSGAYEGVFAKNIAYYQVLGDQADATVSFDMLERIGWRGNLEARYLGSRRLSSQANFSYLEDKAPRRKRWTVNGRYHQALGRRTAVSGSGNFVSDRYYFRDFSDNLEQRLNRNLYSYLSLYHAWSRASLRAALDHYQYLDLHTTTSRLPEANFSLYQTELVPRFLSLAGSSLWLTQRTSDSVSVSRRQGWDSRADLISSLRLAKWISLNPRLTMRATWFDHDIYGSPNAWRWLYSGGLSASTTLYGILPARIGPLDGFRHVLQPGLSYAFAPEINQSRFQGFGSIGGISRQSYMSLSVNNTFQARVRQGKERAKLDLASAWLGAGYDYLAQGRRWSNLSLSSSLLPGNRYFEGRLGATYDPYLRRTQNTSLYLGLRLSGRWLGEREEKREEQEAASPEPADTLTEEASGAPADSAAQGREGPKPTATDQNNLPWSLNLGYDRNWSPSYDNSNLQGTLNFDIARNWRIGYSRYYNLEQGEMVSESYSVYRDLHCWEARFSSSRSGVYWSYEFRINLKAIPELKVHIPRSGSSAY